MQVTVLPFVCRLGGASFQNRHVAYLPSRYSTAFPRIHIRASARVSTARGLAQTLGKLEGKVVLP